MKRCFKRCFLLAVTMLSSMSALAQPAEEADSESASAKTTVAPLPIVFYSPETKTAFGAALNIFRRPAGADEDARPSILTPLFIYSLKNQLVSVLSGSHYWDEERNNLSASISYTNFPDLFHGIGNDTDADYEEDFTTETYGFGFEYLRLVRENFRVGFGNTLGHALLLEREQDGFLSSGDIAGSEGGWVSGIGVSLNYDDRDDITYPTSGGLTAVGFQIFDGALGSDYDFRVSSAESRRYQQLGTKTVLAARALLSHVDGGPPFQFLPALGGDSLMRGYYGGRFRDRDLVAAEGEIRRPLWKRLGIAVFGSVGQVAPNPSDLSLGSFHGAGGFGLRYLFLASESLNLRFDFGWSEDESGSYISLGEAF